MPRPRRPAPHPHVEAAKTWARDVLSGRIIMGKMIKVAAAAFLDDLKCARRRGSRFIFDPTKAERACAFMELLPHTKGKWVANQEPFKLEAWQCFLVVQLFGFLERSTKLRRYRTVLLFVARKNGKSDLAARIGLYMFVADGEFGAEVYSGATSEKQAWEVFRPARLMALNCPDLAEHFGIEINAKNLSTLERASRFEPVIGKPGDGAAPSCAIVDEYHEHKTDDLFGTMETGMGSREQPLMLVITTAGNDVSGPCYGMVSDARKVLAGVTTDDRLLALLFEPDEDDGWDSDEALLKANPNIGVSAGEQYLKDQRDKAVTSPRLQGRYRTKHVNQFVGARNAYFSLFDWIQCGDVTKTVEDFHHLPAIIGVDLASTVDIAAVVLLVLLGDDRYAAFGFFYIPERQLKLPGNDHYREWHTNGRLIVTDGDVIDLTRIQDDIEELCKWFEVWSVGYDPLQATQMAVTLSERGIPMVEVRPSTLTLSQPMKLLDGWMISKKIIHNGCPVMTWMISNVVAKEDAKDNVYPRKERPENKIDGVVALLTAMARLLALSAEREEEKGSYLDHSDLLILS